MSNQPGQPSSAPAPRDARPKTRDASSVAPGWPGATREEMLSRIRRGLGRESLRGRGTEKKGEQVRGLPTPAPVLDESIIRTVPPTADLVAHFAAQAAAAGMKVHRLRAAEVPDRVAALLAEVGAKKIVVGVGDLLQAQAINDALHCHGITIVDWQSSPGLDAQFDVDAGITDVQAAIAETGTLVCCTDAGHSRGLSLLPPVHVAIVRASDIVPDLVDYWGRWANPGAGGEMPSSIVLITGPSKTADIEGELITGVHGPGQVFVVLVEDA
jgi:L-lactate dehydrogenase complex protein LldG